MTDDTAINALARALVERLATAGRTMTAAESCTGGWIAKAITDVPGSSAVFAYGVVSYSNGAKESILGVDPQTLADHGAVSEATVREMAEGVVRLSAADVGVAVSGVAGPDGGSDEKPVGTVWFAWTTSSDGKLQTDAEKRRFDGDRDAVRRASVLHALRGIRDRLGR
ncbi:MAG: CinA family protein [Woeseiaceae bacterium]|nr:CinA family protein [Woeseiaceae bacterium]